MSTISDKRKSTKVRHELVRQKFNEFMAPNTHGFHPAMDSVIGKISGMLGYSESYVKSILKA